jgi:hypothetical protein
MAMNSLRKFSACWLLAFGQLQVGQLGDAIDQFGHLGAEQLGDVGIGRPGILDRVVQKGGDDRRIIQPLFGQDGRHGDGMAEIGLARLADLALVHLHPIGIGPADQIGIAARIVVADQGDQVFDVDHDRPASGAPTLRPAPQCSPCASIRARSSFSSDMSSTTGRSISPVIRSAIWSSSGSSTSIWVWWLSIIRSRRTSADWVSSAISRSARPGSCRCRGRW